MDPWLIALLVIAFLSLVGLVGALFMRARTAERNLQKERRLFRDFAATFLSQDEVDKKLRVLAAEYEAEVRHERRITGAGGTPESNKPARAAYERACAMARAAEYYVRDSPAGYRTQSSAPTMSYRGLR